MNALAVAVVKAHEGCTLSAYKDSGGVWTIGWGATGPDVTPGTVWTQAVADARLESDLAHVEATVRGALKLGHAPHLSDGQMGALISFAYNVGTHALSISQLLRHVCESDWIPAAKEFPRWDHDGGKDVKGLLIRRFEEAALFLRGSP